MRIPWFLACAACGAPSTPISTPTPPAPATLAIVSAAELVAPGIVSSEHTEIRMTASPDGNTLLWGSTDRPGGPGGWDIWRTQRTGAAWSPPAPVAFNSDANDFDPSFSPDGRWVYFFSNRAGGVGGDDIYRAPVTADGFGPAQHLGREVNTPGDEWAPALSGDQTKLLFASNQPGGKHDLFIARVVGDGFAPAEPLPGAVNTPDSDEFDATFLADGHSIVFARSADVNQAPIDLYFAALGPDGYRPATPLPATVNVAGGYTLGPAVAGDVLYFTGKRPEASAGKADIYRVRYRVTGAP